MQSIAIYTLLVCSSSELTGYHAGPPVPRVYGGVPAIELEASILVSGLINRKHSSQ